VANHGFNLIIGAKYSFLVFSFHRNETDDIDLMEYCLKSSCQKKTGFISATAVPKILIENFEAMTVGVC
jgi:hypothetical protein